jgi:hypothetical protein
MPETADKMVSRDEALTKSGRLKPGYTVYKYRDEEGNPVTEYYHSPPRQTRGSRRKRA